MSWDENFQKCLDDLLQKKSTNLITDEKANRIRTLLMQQSDGNKTDSPRFRQYVKDKGLQIVTCEVLGFENELCVPAKEVKIFICMYSRCIPQTFNEQNDCHKKYPVPSP